MTGRSGMVAACRWTMGMAGAGAGVTTSEGAAGAGTSAGGAPRGAWSAARCTGASGAGPPMCAGGTAGRTTGTRRLGTAGIRATVRGRPAGRVCTTARAASAWSSGAPSPGRSVRVPLAAGTSRPGRRPVTAGRGLVPVAVRCTGGPAEAPGAPSPEASGTTAIRRTSGSRVGTGVRPAPAGDAEVASAR
ncbi:hypothetical protein EH183_43015 [Streptomyces sp. CB01881]|nr:hypothetical protein EH183_43015 [Streptomyces sp. CB01881]